MNIAIQKTWLLASVLTCFVSTPLVFAETNIQPLQAPVVFKETSMNTNQKQMVAMENNRYIRSLESKKTTVFSYLANKKNSKEPVLIENIDIVNVENKPTIPMPLISPKANKLAEKMVEAEFTIMALNDENFIRQALAIINHKEPEKIETQYLQCVYNKLDRNNYLRELYGVAQYLTDNYPDDIDAYIEKLDFLIPIIKQIHNHKDKVTFDIENLQSSSALLILTKSNAEEFERLVTDERYAPLLATIGLPAKRTDGNIEDLSLMQVDSIMDYVYQAAALCQ